MSLIKNSAWNIFGLAIPSLVAIPAMGLLARYLGVEKFGLFTLAYAIIGYAGIFDVGLTRAVVRSVAVNRNDELKLRKIIGTSTRSVLLLGCVASGLLAFYASALVKVLNVSSTSVGDITSGLQWLSLSIPAFLLTQIWSAALEGTERFAQLNIQKSFTSSLLSLLPALAVLVKPSFTNAIIGLLMGRLLSAAIGYRVCKHYLPRGKQGFDALMLRELINFGGWITVSNIISPVMVYFDRFILSHIAGAERVAFYTAPSEAVNRMLIIPGGVARALFPKLSDVSDRENHDAHRINSFRGIFVVCALMAIPVFIFSEKIMVVWMGKAYAGEPSIILRVLLVGFIFNSLAQVPFAHIQAKGFSRTTALVHLVEVMPYLLILYFLILKFSILGAALAWSFRVTVDFFAFSAISKRLKL